MISIGPIYITQVLFYFILVSGCPKLVDAPVPWHTLTMPKSRPTFLCLFIFLQFGTALYYSVYIIGLLEPIRL